MAQTVPVFILLITSMETSPSIAIINIVSQLGAGKTAQGNVWVTRCTQLRSMLKSIGITLAEVITILEPDPAQLGSDRLRYLESVADVCRQVYNANVQCLERQILPINLGGDHSLTIGSAAASSDFVRKESGKPLGLIWVDAHVDMNTADTSPSGNIHGMALAALCGLGAPGLTTIGRVTPAMNSRNVACIGLRFADDTELPHLTGLGIKPYTMRDIDQHGCYAVINDCLSTRLTDIGGVHLSLDLDVLDPSIAPAVNSPFPGGMTFREVRTICDAVADSGLLVSLDIAEHNPELGHEDLMLPIICELVACALGNSVMPR